MPSSRSNRSEALKSPEALESIIRKLPPSLFPKSKKLHDDIQALTKQLFELEKRIGEPLFSTGESPSFEGEPPIPRFRKDSKSRRVESVRRLAVAAALGAMAQEKVIYDQTPPPESRVVVVDTRAEIKKYFAKHPEKMRQMNPHEFEELVADILRDLGYQTELTQKTRDGGRDIYAYMKTEVTTFLTLVECKRYGAKNRVGIEIVQRMFGVCQAETTAHKGMIVTTSFFTRDAVQERQKSPVEHVLDLVDYDRLTQWLQRYKQ